MTKGAPAMTPNRRRALREVERRMKALAKDPLPDTRELTAVAGWLQVAGRPADSLRVLKRVLGRDAGNLKAHYLAARAHEALGRVEVALEGYRLLTRRIPPWPAPHLRAARASRTRGEHEAARDHMEAYLSRRPDDHGARRDLARWALQDDQARAAIPHLERLARDRAALPRDLECLGVALAKEGRLGEALAVLTSAFRTHPECYELGLRLARLRMRRNETRAVLEIAGELLARRPGDAAVLSLAASASMRRDDPSRALTFLERLHRERTEDPEIRLRIAEAHLATGDLAEARRVLEVLVDRHPRLSRAALRLAEIHRKQGNRTKARDLYGRCLAAHPGDALALLRVGEMALDDGDPRAALSPLRRLVMARPANPVAHTRLGVALRRAGKGKEARRHLERALELQPTSGEAALELGHLLRDQRALPAAKVAYERVLQVAPATPHATRASYELGHLAPAPARPAPVAGPGGKIVRFPGPRREEGLVAPDAAWRSTRPA